MHVKHIYCKSDDGLRSDDGPYYLLLSNSRFTNLGRVTKKNIICITLVEIFLMNLDVDKFPATTAI